MTKLKSIPGMSEVYIKRLHDFEIRTIDQLLELGATQEGRTILAVRVDTTESLVLRWICHADLARIKGLDPDHSQLLEAAEILHVADLAKWQPEALYVKLDEINETLGCGPTHKLVRRDLTVEQVADWINQAKHLPQIASF